MPPKYSDRSVIIEVARIWVALVVGGQQLLTMLGLLSSLFKTAAELRLENLASRHQLGVLRRSAPKQLKLTPPEAQNRYGHRREVKTENRKLKTENLIQSEPTPCRRLEFEEEEEEEEAKRLMADRRPRGKCKVAAGKKTRRREGETAVGDTATELAKTTGPALWG